MAKKRRRISDAQLSPGDRLETVDESELKPVAEKEPDPPPPPHPGSKRTYVTEQRAASALGWSPSAVVEAIQDERLPAVYAGGSYWIHNDDLGLFRKELEYQDLRRRLKYRLSHPFSLVTNPPLLPSMAILFSLIVLFYTWTAEPGYGSYWHGMKTNYSLLADALLNGQTSLIMKPPPELLAMKDPFDPVANNSYRLHDAILYRNRYYLYWGLTPVLILYLPVRILAGVRLPDETAALIFSIAGLFCMFFLIDQIRRRQFPAVKPWTELTLLTFSGFATMVPILLRGCMIYEVAIACGFFLCALFFLLLYSLTQSKALSPVLLLACSLVLGLEFLCRPHLAACGIALAMFCFLRLREIHDRRQRLTFLAAAFGPAALCVCVQACYNFIRFDSPFEYGVQWQLASIQMRGYQFLSLARGLVSAIFYLFNYPAVFPVFPFVKLQPQVGGLPPFLAAIARNLAAHAPGFMGVDFVGGVLVVLPMIVGLVLLFPFLRSKLPPYLRAFTLGLIATGLIQFVFICCVFPPTERYELDFLPEFVLVLIVLFFWLDQTLKAGFIATGFRIVTAALTIYTTLLVAALSVEGYRDSFRRFDQIEFARAEGVFVPFEKLLGAGNRKSYGAIRALLQFPDCRNHYAQPLVVSGTPGQADFITLKCVYDPGEFRIGWDHWGWPTVFGPVFKVPLNTTLSVEITAPSLFPPTAGLAKALIPEYPWDRMSEFCQVLVNGAEVFKFNNCHMYKNPPDEVYLFRNPLGGTTTNETYLGKVEAAERVAPRIYWKNPTPDQGRK